MRTAGSLNPQSVTQSKTDAADPSSAVVVGSDLSRRE
jgi:hypothetical protein